MSEPRPGEWRALHPGWRPFFALFLLLTLVASVVLYLVPSRTDDLFAWTVVPPVSAAFLGGGYASGFVLVALSARERWWAAARIGTVTIFVFAVATLAVTLAHLDRFHFGEGGAAAGAAWLWLVVYVVVPAGMGVMFVVQRQVPGVDPPVRAPLPAWLVALLGAQAMVLCAIGSALLAVPARVGPRWPWALTPLTGRAVGAWCLPLGVAAVLAAWDRDAWRLRAAAVTYVVLAVLHAVALVRFHDDVRWGGWVTWAYVAFLSSMAVAGVSGRMLARGT